MASNGGQKGAHHFRGVTVGVAPRTCSAFLATELIVGDLFFFSFPGT